MIRDARTATLGLTYRRFRELFRAYRRTARGPGMVAPQDWRHRLDVTANWRADVRRHLDTLRGRGRRVLEGPPYVQVTDSRYCSSAFRVDK